MQDYTGCVSNTQEIDIISIPGTNDFDSVILILLKFLFIVALSTGAKVEKQTKCEGQVGAILFDATGGSGEYSYSVCIHDFFSGKTLILML